MPHRTRIKFLLQEIGEYALKFTWNRIPLPHSPVLAIASVTALDADTQHNKSRASSVSSTGSAGDQKVVLTGNGLAKATKGVEAEFTIDGSRAGPGTFSLFFHLLCFTGLSSENSSNLNETRKLSALLVISSNR